MSSETPRAAGEPPVERRIELPDADATVAFGRALGERLVAGQTLALVGDLGAGKTTLAGGLARGLGIDDPDAVCSPTYLLVLEHPGPVPFVHVDAYLPDKLRGFLADGGVDYLDELDGVTCVEWADQVRDLLAAETTLWCRIEPTGHGGRVALLSSASLDFRWIEDLEDFPPGG